VEGVTGAGLAAVGGYHVGRFADERSAVGEGCGKPDDPVHHRLSIVLGHQGNTIYHQLSPQLWLNQEQQGISDEALSHDVHL